jgi:hypothetical protein
MTRAPDFLIAGGVASGTSFLSSILAQHSDVYLPRNPRPEPNFFHYSWKHGKGAAWYLDQWFREAGGQRAAGERSSLYLNSEPAPGRIRAAFPGVKLIFCLRNPVERAWANYRFTALEGLETLAFPQALESEPRRMADATGIWAEVQPHAYATRSRYAAALRRYFSLFPRDNILLLKSEHLSRHTADDMRRVCRFLGVAEMERIDMSPLFTSPNVRDVGLQARLREQFGPTFSAVVEHVREGTPLPSGSLPPDHEAGIAALRANLHDGKAPMPEDARAWLTEALREEIDEIGRLVDFPVDDWRAEGSGNAR